MSERVINGATIHYEEAGDGNAMVLLHGGAGTAHGHWRKHIPVFAEQHHVIAPDFRGCGQSSHRSEFEADFYARDADDIAELIDQLRLAPVDIVGFSDGGIVALLLASTRPHVVKSVVAIGAQPEIDEQTVAAASGWLPVGSLPERVQAALARYHGEPYWQQLMVMYADVMERIHTAGGTVLSAEVLGQVRCPVLIIHGEKDPYVSMRHAVTLVEQIPGAALRVFSGVAHEVQREAEHELSAAVFEFVANVPNGP